MYAIVGLGQTGLSVARFLSKHATPFFVCDTRERPPALAEFKKNFPQVQFFQLRDHLRLLQAEKIILSPGLPRTTAVLQNAIQKNIPVIGDIELFVQHAQAPIIAITGTNAKGTVTTMVESILKAAEKKVLAGGNIGTPALDLLNDAIPDFYVLEISSFQLESTFSLKATAATILNITPDHLDHHGSMENYVAAKQKIYQNAQAIIFNFEDKATWPTDTSLAKPVRFAFSLSPQTIPRETSFLTIEGRYLTLNGEKILSTDELHVSGAHNWANALAAIGLTSAVGVPLKAIQEGLKNYRGLKHRCVLVRTINGVKWYNDSKGTNVGATQAAIAGLGAMLSGKLILIAGGQGKSQDFSPLQSWCKKYVKNLILFGQDAPILEKTLSAYVPACLQVKNLEEAVAAAQKLSCAGDAVLLSPACASWDMFKDYVERGEKFEALVKEMV
jgi:UDP-N-acetylmuramoylalanine--D-glutamate ligase